MEYLCLDLTYKLRGIFFEVYNVSDLGLPEKIDHKAVIKELENKGILYEIEKAVSIQYKDI